MSDIQQLKQWVSDNYNRGASYFSDSWEEDDYERILDEEGSVEAAIAEMEEIAEVWDSRL